MSELHIIMPKKREWSENFNNNLDPLTTLAFTDLFYDSSVVNLVNDL